MKRCLSLAIVLVYVVCLSGAMAAILLSSDATASDRGLFIAVGQNGVIVTSPDGVNWVRRPHDFGHPNFENIGYFNKTFFVMGGKRGMNLLSSCICSASYAASIRSYKYDTRSVVIFVIGIAA